VSQLKLGLEDVKIKSTMVIVTNCNNEKSPQIIHIKRVMAIISCNNEKIMMMNKTARSRGRWW
jgi:chemotaxis signal transduction protein